MSELATGKCAGGRRRARALHSEQTVERTGYITFRCGHELFGAELTAVREILKLSAAGITPLYRVDPCLLGLINLRGQIKPVVDLGLLLDIPDAERRRAAEDGMLAALILSSAAADLIIAVDAIEGVRWVTAADLGEIPQLARDTLRRFLKATIRTGTQPVSVLAVEHFFAAELWSRYQ